ncbi:malto-oligosyltrehalose synthase [Salinibacterium sp. G-O1]|uniref:malto-oligosyltrehalose synthase n=1 Tax=Salinibacterium sp. G-O1 TaxID=3046208 RepID=UPI0024BB2620|nr:malto-oligosyltrehalose synthase [Salinibacterium sp. G-O1]MDJ0335590.1 malto-oligosyltrehalose synthase [Salinibacterium sp. G-O1]
MNIPISTYRLQIRAGFDLDAAAELVDYLALLGVDWVYLSPILAAEQGSDHGYDVVDHSFIDASRGGAAGLEKLSAAAHSRGMGVLVDIVPNHVGVATPSANPWWWDLLLRGQDSRYAEAFDVDWDFGDSRIRIPVLGDEDIPQLSIVDGQLAYYDQRFPIAEGTADDGADALTVHDRQHYELVNWRRADAELNYRRFFAVNSLAGIRVEVPWVFDESHAEIVRWFDEKLVDGLRVDHPDGVLDPGTYLDDLARATGSAYVLVEKILEGSERMPPHWQAAGTTGYDALGDIDRVLVDPAGRHRLDRLDASIDDAPKQPWLDLIHDTKRAIADGILRSEILRIARMLADETGDLTTGQADDAIAEIAACFPVYRSYLPHGMEHFEEALEDARHRRPDLDEVFDVLVPLLSDPSNPAAQRLQQTTGMVMAKGVEDTAFYRYSRLASLTEVGGDPSEFSITLDEFHSRQEDRHAVFPASLTTLSTHDTKRGEDVRARIDVLSEIPGEWRSTLTSLRELAPLGDGPLENLLWESIVGTWPASRERLHAYAEKAAREAGNSTGWAAPDEDFELRMHALIDSAFDNPAAAEQLAAIVERVSQPGWSNSLAAKLIQLTAPGVPDVYQGSELWETSLVDPDNRRTVDFGLRRQLLASIDGGEHPHIDATGAAKLLVTTAALRLRRDRAELFTRYAPISAIGEAADHLIAFDRGGAVTLATRLPIGLDARGGWGSTTVLLAQRPIVDVITGAEYEGGELELSVLLSQYPVALLATREV